MTYFSGYAEKDHADRCINGFVDGNRVCAQTVKVPFLLVYSEDDPVEPDGPSQEWIDCFEKSENAACAIYRCGSHLACYDDFSLKSRWCDRILLEWVDTNSNPNKSNQLIT